MSIRVSGGGGGGASYPGVTGDGLTPGGLDVAGQATVAGNLSASGGKVTTDVFGDLLAVGIIVGAIGLTVGQTTLWPSGPVSIVQDNRSDQSPALLMQRNYDPDGYGNAFVRGADLSEETVDLLSLLALDRAGSTVQGWFRVSHQGGPGWFQHAPMTAPASITGALSAVTDANAKAVLTSIIAALVADGKCTNNTT